MVRSRRRWRRLLILVLAVAVLATLGAGYERVRESADARAYPPAGLLIDVGGRRLHLSCQGSGSPTVVLEPGLGEFSSVLAWIAPAVAADTRTCVYDRAGRGWSDPADHQLDGRETAADLHELLRRAGIPGPYVVAGHSFGGLYAQSFAAQFPADTAGLVLIDSTAPDWSPTAAAPPADRQWFAGLLTFGARLGLARVVAQTSYASLPAEARAEARAHASTAGFVDSFLGELTMGPTAMRQAAELTDFGAEPLIVVTAGRGHDATWAAAQKRLTTLSSTGEQRVIADATHASLLLDPDDAEQVAAAIRAVVQSVRSVE